MIHLTLKQLSLALRVAPFKVEPLETSFTSNHLTSYKSHWQNSLYARVSLYARSHWQNSLVAKYNLFMSILELLYIQNHQLPVMWLSQYSKKQNFCLITWETFLKKRPLDLPLASKTYKQLTPPTKTNFLVIQGHSTLDRLSSNIQRSNFPKTFIKKDYLKNFLL